MEEAHNVTSLAVNYVKQKLSGYRPEQAHRDPVG